jgi:hypothetical protein
MWSPSFLSPMLAHGDADVMSLSELMISVGLLVVSAGIATAMLLLVFLKPLRRMRRQWKEGRLPRSDKTIYLFFALVVIIGFATVVWKFGRAAYLDVKFREWEEKMEASGKHPKQGAEYKWDRWHINGRYIPDQLFLFVDDVLGTADPKERITVSARLLSPETTDWQPMKWDEKKKAFVARFPPKGQKMEMEFQFRSGWSSYQDKVIGYVPRDITGGRPTTGMPKF